MIPRSIAYHLLLNAAFFAALSGECLASTYYLDAASGNDAASGLSPALAWQSLGKVNAKTFQPGDQLLLKAGSTWTGCLHPKGSGTASAKITIDRYDSGAKPVIHGGGVAGGAVLLENQQYWSINNLEVTNNGSAEPKKMGILIRNDCVGTLSGITVRNCDIHDVAGVMTNYIDGKESGGIVFSITISNAAVPSKWTDIVIENNTIRDVSREGILMQSLWINKPQDPNSNWNGLGPYLPSTKVRIAGNVLERIGGDGIIPWCVKDSVVEHNFVRASNNNTLGQGHAGVWPYFCENVVFQHNEVCETKTRFDGMAFDFDSSNQNCVYQYNYCHDNEGGFLNMCCDSNANGNIARYNISQNDGCVAGGRVFLVHGDGNHGYQVYNNTIYVKNGNPPMFEQGASSNGSDILFMNNIFINIGSGAFNAPGGCTFRGNLYAGNYHIAADARKILANPLLLAPGSGGKGLASLDGYKLASGSPALAGGIRVPNNGGRDYWGNPVSTSSPPSLGAYNGKAVVPTSSIWDAQLSVPGAQDGSGTWNATSRSWWNGTTSTTLPGPATATFGARNGKAGTVTLDGTLVAARLHFLPPGSGSYNLRGGVLQLSEGTIATQADAIISSPIAGSAGLTKTGAATLTLAAENTFSGNLNVAGGALALAPNARVFKNGGTGVLSIGNGAVLSFSGGWGWDATFGLQGVQATDNLINRGTLRHTGPGNSVDASGAGRLFTVGAAGATLDSATAGETFRIGYRYDYGDTLASAGGTLTLTGAGDGDLSYKLPGSGGLVKSGAGTWTLNQANTYTGNTTVQAGNLRLLHASLADASTVSIGAGARLDLAFDGTDDIAGLLLGGRKMPAGTYSTASHPRSFSGPGRLRVTVGASPAQSRTMGLPTVPDTTKHNSHSTHLQPTKI